MTTGTQWPRQEGAARGVWIGMKSFPQIESSLSETQRQFDHFVDRHAPGSGAIWEADGDGSLPGDTVKMTVSSRDVVDDVSERRHTVEFMSLGSNGHWEAVGCIRHSLRELQSLQGRAVQLESTFVIAGPGIPDGRYRHSDVEPFIQAQLDDLEAARLLPMRTRISTPTTEACAP